MRGDVKLLGLGGTVLEIERFSKILFGELPLGSIAIANTEGSEGEGKIEVEIGGALEIRDRGEVPGLEVLSVSEAELFERFE
jgi:hypothetical protein